MQSRGVPASRFAASSDNGRGPRQVVLPGVISVWLPRLGREGGISVSPRIQRNIEQSSACNCFPGVYGYVVSKPFAGLVKARLTWRAVRTKQGAVRMEMAVVSTPFGKPVTGWEWRK